MLEKARENTLPTGQVAQDGVISDHYGVFLPDTRIRRMDKVNVLGVQTIAFSCV